MKLSCHPHKSLSILCCCLMFGGLWEQVSSPVQAAKPKNTPHQVYTAQVREQALQESRVYSGTLQAQRILRLFSQESGRITELPFYAGDSVAQDALLLRLDDRRLRISLSKAKATLRQARQDWQRLKNLSHNKLVSDEERARAETLKTLADTDVRLLQLRLQDMELHAPFAGVLSARLAEPGDVISSNTHVLSLLDPDSLRVEVNITEQHLARLKVGDSVQIQIDALSTERHSGQIARIYPALNAQTRQGVVEIQLSQWPPGARSGQSCRVHLDIIHPHSLSIPLSALRRDREGEYVWLLDAEQRAQRQAVRSGLHLAQHIAILEGLELGQTLITQGFLGLKSGQPVQVVNKTHSPDL